ncbi:hypothetical protein GN958_ATG13693 [Phytophthora infestans]|uniref:DDE Tnp4 domain-containing protein n=1 Tax=Phytophthora infestans TaxID=4787 RepID=A0A8S9UCV5_PHYIN|nr:hypothetical protein GN958_ATG13693 [Phytophthora infestans]
MPLSDFKKLKTEMSSIIFPVAMLYELRNINSPDSDADDSDGDSLLSLLVMLHHTLACARYSVERKNVVRTVAHHALLCNLREAEFRKFTRVSKSTFNVLVEIIHDDIVFRAKSYKAKKRQREMDLQLAITLEWHGAYGNGNSVAHLARDYTVGLGTAPTYVRMRAVSSAFHEKRFGLVGGVVGFVDGTRVNFRQKPHIQGSLFCCDSTVFTKTPIAKHPELYFSGEEYLIGDTGYALSTRPIAMCKLPSVAKE